MDVSIIILNYRHKGLIKQQLKYFFSQATKCSTEAIVVDNNSGDGIGEMLAADFPQVRFIAAPVNKGYAAGNNLGIKVAKGRYILIVNPDIVLSASVVDGLYEYLEEHPDIGIAGPKIINADGSLQYSCVRFPDLWLPVFRRTFFAKTAMGRKWLNRYFMKDWDHATPRDVDWLFGACFFVRKDALEKVGLLDESFFLYLEDTDWCRRFWESGWKVYYVPTVSVIHLLGRSSEGAPFSILFNKSARIHLISFVKYLYKYWGKENPHSEVVSSK